MSAERRQLGGISALGIVVSSMVGAGVFTTSGFALADLGDPRLVLLAWGVAGGIALCGAVGYGALARFYRESGGEYLFLSRTWHPAIGFVAGLVSLLAGFTGAIAFAATSLETYSGLTTLVTGAWPTGSVAVLIVLAATALHLFHVTIGARGQNAVVLIKFVMLFLFLAGACYAYPRRWPGLQELTTREPVPFSLTAFSLSLVWISLSYCGFNASVYIAGEVREPERNVPRAMLLGTLVVGLFYLALNAAFVLAPPFEEIVGREQVALIAAQTLGGPPWAEWIRWTVMLSLFTSVSVMIMTGPRVYAKMADEGLFPRWFRQDQLTPRAAILLQAVLAIVVILISELKQLLSYLGFTLSLSAALTVASLFRQRLRSQLSWPVLGAAGGFVVSTVSIAMLAASQTPWESLAACLTLLLGLIVYQFLPSREFTQENSPENPERDGIS